MYAVMVMCIVRKLNVERVLIICSQLHAEISNGAVVHMTTSLMQPLVYYEGVAWPL